MSHTIKQGADCWIEAVNIRDVRTGDPLDVTGWTVRAVARACWSQRRRTLGQVVAEWHTSPTGSQGRITAGGDVPDRIQVHITPEQTEGWHCPFVVIQAEMTTPMSGEIERIIDECYRVSFQAVV
jgi:hypothetical protein